MKRQDKTIKLLEQIKDVLQELYEYWPLTLRQIYYQLVSKQIIENHPNKYKMLSNLLSRAREQGLIDWQAIEDRSRVYYDLTGWQNSKTFIKRSSDAFLKGYKRDLLQTQKNYIEIWIEKDALSRIFTQTAEPYTVPVVVARGFASVSFLNNFKERVLRQDKPPLILYFGDFDPSGLAIPEAVKNGLMKNGLNVTLKRCALLPGDIKKYNLPHDPDALKDSDRRAARFVELYGRYAVELDALHPLDLIKRIEESIKSNLDENFKIELTRQAADLDEIKTLRTRALSNLGVL